MSINVQRRLAAKVRVEFGDGTDITVAVWDAIALAGRLGCGVTFNFNRIPIVIDELSDPATMVTDYLQQLNAPAVTGPHPFAGMFCCLCGGSLAGHSASILPVGSLGNAHASCVETARAAAAGANEARAYAARTAEARVHAVRESSP